ncbi:hypothetical protein EJ02DRAFT_93870 [Clathrospora elynae]|uniref:Uncharacterized protein n=1 Tax=Clathrospora elynae TaxID=706981 RepID=A0A6A5SXN0_9PLEO|nr:hypothetical protein EJ02DRAFT_93870 [Clathrospora elynae]
MDMCVLHRMQEAERVARRKELPRAFKGTCHVRFGDDEGRSRAKAMKRERARAPTPRGEMKLPNRILVCFSGDLKCRSLVSLCMFCLYSCFFV